MLLRWLAPAAAGTAISRAAALPLCCPFPSRAAAAASGILAGSPAAAAAATLGRRLLLLRFMQCCAVGGMIWVQLAGLVQQAQRACQVTGPSCALRHAAAVLCCVSVGLPPSRRIQLSIELLPRGRSWRQVSCSCRCCTPLLSPTCLLLWLLLLLGSGGRLGRRRLRRRGLPAPHAATAAAVAAGSHRQRCPQQSPLLQELHRLRLVLYWHSQTDVLQLSDGWGGGNMLARGGGIQGNIVLSVYAGARCCWCMMQPVHCRGAQE